ncbi:hypothetical protein Dtox_2641 [Desulfofarcimen acetoxidans DSM 771]|uniref:Uncharacterized protein n=1 Tax=Desulfofarcimen acetoxidans (strain ATCC 49208 / DSM 771 / KCTC 5769 / VKM B-1644 / 5575) TaxID=485916 RepID=C8W133_DESAS|nr:hypothetical protein Dtox_2641 [Desulfofarcimen acetoxidans DSM 771]
METVSIVAERDSDSFTAAKVKYSLRILLSDRQHMPIFFSFLQKLPFLLPLCWAIRGIYEVLYRQAVQY